MIARPLLAPLVSRLRDRRRFIQILIGPRQVGKSTLARQAMLAFGKRSTYVSADNSSPDDNLWIEQQWDSARINCRQSGKWLLVLDEVQKVPRWSEIVKKLWDEDSTEELDLRVMVLGASPLLSITGPSDTLAGRFELTRVGHWSYAEMRDAFGWNADQYIYFGGYPGAADLIEDENRWRRYMLDSLIETTETALARDIGLVAHIDKPNLLRALFRLGCEYSGHIFSYQKISSQLPDAPSAITLANYLDLLAGAGMLRGVAKYPPQTVRQRGSFIKLQVMNTALTSAPSAITFARAHQLPDQWSKLIELAVGAHLAGAVLAGEIDDINYWRERGKEVDFILRLGTKIVAVELKTGRRKDSASGTAIFDKTFLPSKTYAVGNEEFPIERFLETPPRELFA
jgi:predicted AAA+ superfamily ATPase